MATDKDVLLILLESINKGDSFFGIKLEVCLIYLRDGGNR